MIKWFKQNINVTKTYFEIENNYDMPYLPVFFEKILFFIGFCILRFFLGWERTIKKIGWKIEKDNKEESDKK